ncbi:MAG: flagellar export chaperone FlgN [Anaerolineae bacterium]|nr:flagellar export chaperone FlgN [Phycisphaerae bacterium]
MTATENVIDALEEQVGCYQRLAKLAHIQHEHIQQSQTDALLEVLKSRQEVLEEIGRLEQTIAPVKRSWSGFVGTLEQPNRTRAEALVAEATQLLKEITDCDRDDVLVLQQRTLNLGKQINQATVARKINTKYAAAAYGSSQSRMDVQR